MKNNYSDHNIKGTLYVGEDPRPRVNISFRDKSMERIVSCVKKILDTKFIVVNLVILFLITF